MSTIIYPQGVKEITVSLGEKVSVFSAGRFKVFQKRGYPQLTAQWDLLIDASAGTIYTSDAFATDTDIRIEADSAETLYAVGVAPSVITEVNVLDFGADPSGETDSTTAIQNAILTGRPVFLPAGTYLVSAGLDMTLDTIDAVHIYGVPGATTLKISPNVDWDDALFQSRCTYSDEYTVSAVATDTVGSADGTDDSVSRLTITGGVSAFAENQICKIYSSDLSYYGDSNSKNCSGELFEVRSVDSVNNYVYVKGLLKCTYATSIKVRILDKKRVTISDLELDIDESTYDVYDDVNVITRGSMIRLVGIHEPKIRNVTFRKAWAQCLNLIACWMPDIEARFDFVINGTDSSWGPGGAALGYGVTTTVCFGGHIKVMAEGCRHVFTTLHPEETAFVPSRWLEFGETIGTKISGTSVNSNGSPFDTHESGIGLVFENCYVIEPRRGPTGSVRSKGFSNRARGTKYVNCHQIGGYQAFSNLDVNHGAAHTLEYINCSARDIYGASGSVYTFEGSTNAPTINMIGCSARASYRIIDVEAGTCKIVGGIWDIAGDWFAKVRAGATLDVHGCLVDFSAHASSDQFIRMVGASTASVSSVRIKADSKCTGLFYGEDSTGTKACRFQNVMTDSGTMAVTTAGSGTLTITSSEEEIINLDIADGSADATYYVVSHRGGTISKIWSVIHGVVSTADITITANIGATPVTNGVITITQSGSAAGDVDSATPTGANTLTAGQALNLVVAGGGAGGSPRISVGIVITKNRV